jgi:xanthine/CO dehydrogenase XdhC/CoxF family maturation factor
VEASLGPLLPLFERERAAGRALALGVLTHTSGSTYRKPGALILIAADGEYAGLIAGGCLEGDLREHAGGVIAGGQPREVRYDMRGSDDLLWGLGLGCEGAMHILLLRAGPDNDWQPLTHLAAALAAHQPTAIGVVAQSSGGVPSCGSLALPAPLPPGSDRALGSPAVQQALAAAAASGTCRWLEHPGWRLFVLPLSLPPRILLLGAGPDAAPVVDLAARLGWKVTLADHRPAYAVAAHFPGAERVLLAPAGELHALLDPQRYCAAVVMSHHLPSDLAWLRALARSAIGYVGLLGPATRRQRLLAELGADRQRLEPRLHAPVGLPLGGRSPEAIALAIVAEVHAFLYQADAAAVLSSVSVS